MRVTGDEIKDLLEQKYQLYNTPVFIEHDPILIPHRFTRKEDIEIAGFLSATIAWGNRVSILKNAGQLMTLMEDSPFDFISNHSEKDRHRFKKFVHRTFNGTDCMYFLRALQHIYHRHGGLEQLFGLADPSLMVKDRISGFRKVFFELSHPMRTHKHVSDPEKRSGAKRICMFLRWMVRKDKCGVDFGIWNNIAPSQLMMPLDVHTGNISRKLGILNRKQDDWQAVEELTTSLREFDPVDPVKYDFALFGMGVNNDL